MLAVMSYLPYANSTSDFTRSFPGQRKRQDILMQVTVSIRTLDLLDRQTGGPQGANHTRTGISTCDAGLLIGTNTPGSTSQGLWRIVAWRAICYLLPLTSSYLFNAGPDLGTSRRPNQLATQEVLPCLAPLARCMQSTSAFLVSLQRSNLYVRWNR